MSRLTRVLLEGAAILAVAAASIAVALLVTPMQKVVAAGQTVEVGTTAPTLAFSGPAELDLFGQQIPTSLTFFGPVRPRLSLTHITLSSQLKNFVGGAQGLEDALVTGFRHYFFWEIGITALAAVLLMGAVTGWLRRGVRHTVVLVALALVVTEAVNLGAVMLTAYSAPAKLRQVHTLQALVGSAPRLPDPPDKTETPPGTRVAVIGDSTAAGLGNKGLPHPTPSDRVCDRSVNSYPRNLASANGWRVTNLACTSATIANGLLGPQVREGRTLPPQITDPAVTHASVVIVSIGANDVDWTDLLLVCAASAECDNNAARAYFQQHLASFSAQYLQLLSDLQLLPNHPQVVVNLYYAPVSPDDECLAEAGITTAKQKSLLSTLAALNSILGKGAEAASFQVARPDFTGHGVCSSVPYVQGLHGPAPFHPTPAGELAIALADEHALQHATAEPPPASAG